jgi:uncharacterized membrane protein YkoI
MKFVDRIGFVVRFALTAPIVLALAPAHAEEADRPLYTGTVRSAAGGAHACLSQKERRAANQTGRVVRLAAAMRTAKSRMPGTVVRARLCRGHQGLVYVLTVLAHDGKVARLTVDAVKGTLVGER